MLWRFLPTVGNSDLQQQKENVMGRTCVEFPGQRWPATVVILVGGGQEPGLRYCLVTSCHFFWGLKMEMRESKKIVLWRKKPK